MSKKLPKLPVEERFFLNLEEELSLTVPHQDFEFTLSIPSMTQEATVSLGAVSIAQSLLRRPEYADLMKSITLPRFEMPSAEESDTPEEDIELKERHLELDKIQHVRYALNFLPNEFIDTVNNIAYLNVVVTDITYKGKEVWIKVDGEDKLIDTFQDFVTYVRSKRLRFGPLSDQLIRAYGDWLEAVEVSPQEIKN